MIWIDLPPNIEKQLQALADETGRSTSECAREAVIDFVEDAEDARIAMVRLNEQNRLWSQEDLERDLDLEH